MQTSVLHCPSTKAIWDDLKERFDQRNGPLIFQLKRELSEATNIIKQFFQMVKTQFGVSIKCLRSDNAKELALTDFLASIGTQHQFSCVERPKNNSVVERKHQHLLNVAIALFFQSQLPVKLWVDCVVTATYTTRKNKCH
uniref:Retrovirus-related Pol polyprotein from transposon TNT 1-94 n=1 Tax=Cajanus cajan TaxID=3821 RepID=A0A151SPT4_CAJCA|nr:Retrovirus-related Pol polyprotein from transposon TNT 1-94 [Cajanus cajan]